MKKIVGILVLFFGFCCVHGMADDHDTHPPYGFNLALKMPPYSSSVTHFTDLNGDRLTEILYFDRDEENNSIFVVLDTFGKEVWSIPFDKKPGYLFFHDVDKNGYEEIYFTTELTSYSEENEIGEGYRRIDCYTFEGDFLWSHTWTVHPGYMEYTCERREYGFADFDADGIQDIITNSFMISTDGTLLHEDRDDFN